MSATPEKGEQSPYTVKCRRTTTRFGFRLLVTVEKGRNYAIFPCDFKKDGTNSMNNPTTGSELSPEEIEAFREAAREYLKTVKVADIMSS